MRITQPAAVREVLEASRTVAVLGAHAESWKPAFYVPDYLYRHGYRILPVNPRFVGTTMWGEPVRATLAELDEAVEVVDVFRRSGDVPGHLDDILVLGPKVVWLQSGIRNEEVADRLVARGIDVVQDRCMLADHRAFGMGIRGGG